MRNADPQNALDLIRQNQRSSVRPALIGVHVPPQVDTQNQDEAVVLLFKSHHSVLWKKRKALRSIQPQQLVNQ